MAVHITSILIVRLDGSDDVTVQITDTPKAAPDGSPSPKTTPSITNSSMASTLSGIPTLLKSTHDTRTINAVVAPLAQSRIESNGSLAIHPAWTTQWARNPG